MSACAFCNGTGRIGDTFCGCAAAQSLRARIHADARVRELDAQIDHALAAPTQARTRTLVRPPLERYIRDSLTFGDAITVEPGLEYRASDDLPELRARLAERVRAVALAVEARIAPIDGWQPEDVQPLALALERELAAVWPDRAWFCEIHHVQGWWTQIFQPYGLPKNG